MWARLNERRGPIRSLVRGHRVIWETENFFGIDITEQSGSIGSSESMNDRSVPKHSEVTFLGTENLGTSCPDHIGCTLEAGTSTGTPERPKFIGSPDVICHTTGEPLAAHSAKGLIS